MSVITFGTVIHGTLRNEDLLPAFLSVLERLDGPAHIRFMAELYNDRGEYRANWGEFGSQDVDDVQDAINNAIDLPFVTFGAHQGDGSDFGFWVEMGAMEDAIQYGEIAQIPAGVSWFTVDGQVYYQPDPISPRLEPAEGGDSPNYVLAVNDHGNCTLYDMDGEEIWSVV